MMTFEYTTFSRNPEGSTVVNGYVTIETLRKVS